MSHVYTGNWGRRKSRGNSCDKGVHLSTNRAAQLDSAEQMGEGWGQAGYMGPGHSRPCRDFEVH